MSQLVLFPKMVSKGQCFFLFFFSLKTNHQEVTFEHHKRKDISHSQNGQPYFRQINAHGRTQAHSFGGAQVRSFFHSAGTAVSRPSPTWPGFHHSEPRQSTQGHILTWFQTLFSVHMFWIMRILDFAFQHKWVPFYFPHPHYIIDIFRMHLSMNQCVLVDYTL